MSLSKVRARYLMFRLALTEIIICSGLVRTWQSCDTQNCSRKTAEYQVSMRNLISFLCGTLAHSMQAFERDAICGFKFNNTGSA